MDSLMLLKMELMKWTEMEWNGMNDFAYKLFRLSAHEWPLINAS